MGPFSNIPELTDAQAQAMKSGVNSNFFYIDAATRVVKVVKSDGTVKKVQATVGGVTGDVSIEA